MNQAQAKVEATATCRRDCPIPDRICDAFVVLGDAACSACVPFVAERALASCAESVERG